MAEWVAEASNGRRDRAVLLASDDGFMERLSRWRTLPDRLDGSGATVAVEVAELLGTIDASLGPLRARHAAEIEQLTTRASSLGQRGTPGRKEAEERHKREERRWRTDEIRSGLAALAAAERDRLLAATAGSVPGGARTGRAAAAAVAAIRTAAAALVRNPNEALLLQDLFLILAPSGGVP
jgi:DNA polymerase-3 subunit delta'